MESAPSCRRIGRHCHPLLSSFSPLRPGCSVLAAAAVGCLAGGVLGAHASKKKPLFEYDDHYVMLNDRERNSFYRDALKKLMPDCLDAARKEGRGCNVLDVGAGSGLLSMFAANLGAENVLAIEANPSLATLAEKTIAKNRDALFPSSNVTVVAELSSKVDLASMPQGRRADLLVTETFGTMLLGEGAINFVPDARDRLLKKDGIVIPAGGCQYVTLVEIPGMAATHFPESAEGLNLTRFQLLQDTVYWKASIGASRMPFTRLTERICVLEIDLYKDTREVIPLNRTFRIRATKPGTVHAALFDWDIWVDRGRTELLSTAPGSRGFAGDVAWGWLLQLQEEASENWQFGSVPKRLVVGAGDELDLGVEYIARGISVHARARHAAPGSIGAPGVMPEVVGSPSRMRGVNRGDMIEANEYYLPLVGDRERHRFYADSLDMALRRNTTAVADPTVLDCSGGAGVTALVAASKHGRKSLALTHRSEFAKILRGVAQDNGVGELVEAYASEPRDMLEALLPESRRVDVVVVEPPGTPLFGLSPFAVLPSIRKYLLKEDGVVIPSGACFEIGLVESGDLNELFSVPNKGRWENLDLTVWNEEARRQGVLTRLMPYTKWFGPHSTMAIRWLSAPRCIHEVNLEEYGKVGATLPPETNSSVPLVPTSDGSAHALLGRWKIWDSGSRESQQLGADSESEYFGRALTWSRYVQAVAAPNTVPGVLDPVVVRKGQPQQLDVSVRQGAGKTTGVAGPEFVLRLRGSATDDEMPGRADGASGSGSRRDGGLEL